MISLSSCLKKRFCNLTKLANSLGVSNLKVSNYIKEKFNEGSFESEIIPIINNHMKNFPKLNRFLFQTAFNKEKKIFIPTDSNKYLERMIIIKDYLKQKLDISEEEITDILYSCPTIALEYPDVIKRNIDFIIDFFRITNTPNSYKVILDYPKVLTVSKENYKQWTSYFMIYLSDEKVYTQEFMDNLIKDNPLLLTCEPNNIHEFIKILIEIREKVRFLCKKNINASKKKKELIEKCDEYVQEIKERNRFAEPQEYKPHHKISNCELENKYLNFETYDLIKLNPLILLTTASKFKMIFETLKEKIGIDYYVIVDIISKCPDILFINKNGLLEKKIDFLLKLNASRFVWKQFFKAYPFMLTKSFNSYIKKYEYLKSLGYKLNGDFELYPLIYIFDFSKEIKPKLTIIKNIEHKKRLQVEKKRITSFDSQENLSELENEVISISDAFSISKEEFCKKTGVSIEEYDKITNEVINENLNNKYKMNLNERDLVFSYSKYNYY